MLSQPNASNPALDMIEMVKDPEKFEARIKQLIATKEDHDISMEGAAKALGALADMELSLAEREKDCDQRDVDHVLRTDAFNTRQELLNSDIDRQTNHATKIGEDLFARTRAVSRRETITQNLQVDLDKREDELAESEKTMRLELETLGMNLAKAAATFLKKL